LLELAPVEPGSALRISVSAATRVTGAARAAPRDRGRTAGSMRRSPDAAKISVDYIERTPSRPKNR
jgi:hypothetical protein